MIKLNGVSKKYGDKTVLYPVDLAFADARTHVLLGSSGSGKSTLLRIIMGLVTPDTGDVWIGSERMTARTQRELALKIGYVLQEGGLFPHMTAKENASLIAKTQGWPKARVAARLEELAEIVGLSTSLLDHYPRQLSGGQRQRVGIMRAAFLDPQLMLLDEPLGALDPIIRSNLQTELKRIFDRLKKIVILVTHDIGEAAYFGNTVTLMHEGRVVQHGEFQELLRSPAEPFVSEFINAQRTLHQVEVST